MCRELMQGYENWLKEILFILDAVCENVVPAGKPDEAIYWRTKELYEDARRLTQEGKKAELEALLYTYCKDGRALLQQLGQEWCWRKLRVGVQSDKGFGCGGKSVDKIQFTERTMSETEKFLQEENRISLRRRHGKEIVGSLEMLVNLAFLLGEYCDYPVENVKALFELDNRYEVKQARVGLTVEVNKVQAQTMNLKFA